MKKDHKLSEIRKKGEGIRYFELENEYEYW